MAETTKALAYPYPYPVKTVPYLLLATLPLLLLSGQAQRAPKEVNGIVGGTALLSVMVPRNLHVVEVRWKFGSAGPDKVRLGDSKKREFVPFNLSYTNNSQFFQRLDMYNEATLRIRNLTKGDGGVYKADVQFNDPSANEEEFQLNVYDPVPIPLIETRSLVNTSDGCNVTLVCTANDINISWAKQAPLGDLIQMQNNSDGNMLNLSINTQTATNDKYFCFAWNPAEKKNASIADVCPQRPPQRNRAILYSILLVFPAVIVVLYFYFWWRRRKKKKLERNHEDDKAVHSLVSHTQEEMTDCPGNKRRPPDGEEVTSQLKNDSRNLQQKDTKLNTVYAEVQPTLDNTLT